MLTLSRFMNKPYKYRKRNVPTIDKYELINCYENNSCYIIDFNIKSSSILGKIYKSSIELYTDNNITQNTKCSLKCTCPSFKYEFENILYTHGSLIGKPNIIKMPKNSGLFTCKHIYGCIPILFHFKTINNITKFLKEK